MHFNILATGLAALTAGTQCVTENITQYFVNLPAPTGNVLSAIGSYGKEVVEECRATATGHDYVLCTVSDPKDWCGFTTAARPDILSSYSTYVSEVVSYGTSKSSTISILSTSCPVTWIYIYPREREWLKIATAHANQRSQQSNQSNPSLIIGLN
ncbi:hypothetical protein N657DRAFT_636838 [Parathielavia appendiculata]|uniref:DUF7735 domain-containing protein n=1 Tax=Parathielavia appendiculata TaxID=2587402 RepID=A0AAN6TT16_9PEZI|nr:hypothetical protein N657DRAFT_636838 [Parathielavia appendiculata]